jgi:hypothetical protein
MGSGRRTDLRIAIRHALSSVAIFAQVLLLFTPLLELRHRDGATAAIAAGFSTPEVATISADHGQSPPHNPTTCPACIAQSLHAQLASSMHLPTIVVTHRVVADRGASALPQHDPPSSHHSRAPPVVS